MKNRIAIKITLIYLLTGFLWILFSDQLILSFSGSSDIVTNLQTYKGWFFVSLTAFLLFLLIEKEINKKNKIEADLIHAKEKAEESDRLKSAFLANMSHEIRTPLNGILGFCELMHDDGFTKEEKQVFAQHMAKNGSDFLKLINDIMDISKIQENQFPIAKKNFKVNEILEDIYKKFQQSELRKHRRKLDFKLIKGDETLDTELFSDSVRLTHVLENLLSNSFFFTNKGFVHFGYRKLDSGLEFFVEDSGCGIDLKSQEMIFKPFFKGQDPVIGNKGFGLGLAISKGLVRLLGGDLRFNSTPNVGTRFYFTIGNKETIPIVLEKNEWKRERLKSREINIGTSDIYIRQN